MSNKEEAAANRKRPEQFKLVNAYDEIVKAAVSEMMDTTDACKCERCYLDVCAIVFNQGYSHFVNTREGELLKKVPEMNHGNRAQLMVQILHAIKKVQDFPHHSGYQKKS